MCCEQGAAAERGRAGADDGLDTRGLHIGELRVCVFWCSGFGFVAAYSSCFVAPELTPECRSRNLGIDFLGIIVSLIIEGVVLLVYLRLRVSRFP